MGLPAAVPGKGVARTVRASAAAAVVPVGEGREGDGLGGDVYWEEQKAESKTKP